MNQAAIPALCIILLISGCFGGSGQYVTYQERVLERRDKSSQRIEKELKEVKTNYRFKHSDDIAKYQLLDQRYEQLKQEIASYQEELDSLKTVTPQDRFAKSRISDQVLFIWHESRSPKVTRTSLHPDLRLAQIRILEERLEKIKTEARSKLNWY